MVYPEMMFIVRDRSSGELVSVKGVAQVMSSSIRFVVGYVLVASSVLASPSPNSVSSLYDKLEVMILMRDGDESVSRVRPLGFQRESP